MSLPRRFGERRRVVCAAGAALLAVACTARGPLDVAALEARYPQLAKVRGHQLAELRGHFWIAGDELLEFVCLWPATRAIDVSVRGASLEERKLVQKALAALEPLIERQFALASEGSAPSARVLEIEILEGPDAEDPDRLRVSSGDAIADCEVDAEPGRAYTGDVLPAELTRASVRVRRARADALGRVRALDETELLAALLHELGHALGFSTHTLGGDSVMQIAPREVRRITRSVVAGRDLRDSTLVALYRLPSGVVTARGDVPVEARTTLQVFDMLARERGWGAARTRAGATSAELWWDAGTEGRVTLRSQRPSKSTPWAESFSLVANAAGRAALRKRPAAD